MADTEKVTINLSVVDLGKIDLLVEDGFYSNRTDLIRTAIRNQLDTHDTEIKESTVRRSGALGVLIYTRSGLEKKQADGVRLKVVVIGMLLLPNDVSPELAVDVFESIQVYGVFRAGKGVRKALEAEGIMK